MTSVRRVVEFGPIGKGGRMPNVDRVRGQARDRRQRTEYLGLQPAPLNVPILPTDEYLSASFRIGCVEDVPYEFAESGTVDELHLHLVCPEHNERIPKDTLDVWLPEVVGVLRPGGQFFLTDEQQGGLFLMLRHDADRGFASLIDALEGIVAYPGLELRTLAINDCLRTDPKRMDLSAWLVRWEASHREITGQFDWLPSDVDIAPDFKAYTEQFTCTPDQAEFSAVFERVSKKPEVRKHSGLSLR